MICGHQPDTAGQGFPQTPAGAMRHSQGMRWMVALMRDDERR